MAVFQASSSRGNSLYPLVNFAIFDVATHTWKTKQLLVEPHTWKWDEINSRKPSLKQVLLILAWAISIHKSQGQSLDAVSIDLSGAFESGESLPPASCTTGLHANDQVCYTGQAYVSLSQAKHIKGLQVLNFQPEKASGMTEFWHTLNGDYFLFV